MKKYATKGAIGIKRFDLLIIVSVILLILIVLVYAFPSFLTTPPSQQVTTPARSQTPSPLFYVTLSPDTQTTGSDSHHCAHFDVTIAGHPEYPCVVTIYGGSISYLPKYDVYDSGVLNTPTSSYGDSKTFAGLLAEPEENEGTRNYYVTVEDSSGHTYTSNTVTVEYW